MLRITCNHGPGESELKLEGKLVGPWAHEAKECWQRSLLSKSNVVWRFDLTGLTQIDAAGKQFLAAARASGVELVASGCLMRAIVAELTQTPISS